MGAILAFSKRHASQPITSRRQACRPPEVRTSVARAQETHRTLPEPATAKLRGITYTPEGLASFVAEEIVAAAQTTVPRAKRRTDPSPRADGPNRADRPGNRPSDRGTVPRDQPLRVLDPAVGQGRLLLSLLAVLAPTTHHRIKVHGYDTDCNALDLAEREIRARFPNCSVRLDATDFLTAASRAGGVRDTDRLFSPPTEPVRHYDMIIANPPYVRTQTMGREQSRRLARSWGLSGRIDLYHAFLIGIARLLAPGGIAGVIVSNRFMTTKAGVGIRAFLADNFNVLGIWDLGDTKMFRAAVLPAVLLLGHKQSRTGTPARFVSIYETAADAEHTAHAHTPIDALRHTGVIRVDDGRAFRVRRGILRPRNEAGGAHGAVWRITTPEVEEWLRSVADNTWSTFGAIGRVRVGVKSCADKVFVRDDWHLLPAEERPELLRPLATHRSARCYRPLACRLMQIVYPHTVTNGKRRAVNLAAHPRAARYLNNHRIALEGRRYLMKSGRKWYELWVPQDPDAWERPKLIFRDISAQPMFWVDMDGMVVNGDCYWWQPFDRCDDVLWLAAAVGNSPFVAQYYDYRFNNKLYAGRRRFMAQYVKTFPIPDPDTSIGKEIVKTARQVFDLTPSDEAHRLHEHTNKLVSKAFGLRTDAEEVLW